MTARAHARISIHWRVAAIVAVVLSVLTGSLALSQAATAAVVCTETACANGAAWSTARGSASTGWNSYWGQAAGHNCTNYVAWQMIQNGVARFIGSGDAATWATQAVDHGILVDHTPTVGSIAQWDSTAGEGSAGHVAYVEAVNGSSVTVAEDFWHDGNQTGPFDWETISAGAPSDYIHPGGNAGEYLATPVVAFRANTNNLFTYQLGGLAGDQNQGMATGTDPSIVQVSTGDWLVAFQANTGNLELYDTSAGYSTDLQQGMAAGSSPAIAALANGGYAIAFRSNLNQLNVYSSVTGTDINTALGMSNNSDPAIASSGGNGWVAAIEANTDNLYTYSSATGANNTSMGMAAGTSPSIIDVGGSVVAAFQANTGNLFTYSQTTLGIDTRVGMAAGTSPSIAAVGGGYRVAVEANTDVLYSYSPSSGVTNLSQGMAATTNPSLVGLSDGTWRIAFQSNVGQSSVYDSSVGYSTTNSAGMGTGASPSIW